MNKFLGSTGPASRPPHAELEEAGRSLEDGTWQQVLFKDPDYGQFLNTIERIRSEVAGRRADELIKAGKPPF